MIRHDCHPLKYIKRTERDLKNLLLYGTVKQEHIDTKLSTHSSDKLIRLFGEIACQGSAL